MKLTGKSLGFETRQTCAQITVLALASYISQYLHLGSEDDSVGL